MKHILFLCSGNYYRSRFAEELFNFHSEKAQLNWWASSRALAIERGSENDGSLSPFTIEALKARNIIPAGLARFPLACRSEDFETADHVIAMKEADHRPLIADRFPGWQNRVTYWHVHDIDAARPAEAIDMIDRLVSDLIVRMTSGEN